MPVNNYLTGNCYMSDLYVDVNFAYSYNHVHVHVCKIQCYVSVHISSGVCCTIVHVHV